MQDRLGISQRKQGRDATRLLRDTRKNHFSEGDREHLAEFTAIQEVTENYWPEKNRDPLILLCKNTVGKEKLFRIPFYLSMSHLFQKLPYYKMVFKENLPLHLNFFCVVICSMITLRENLGSSTQTFDYLRLLSHQPLFSFSVLPSW